MREHFPLQGMKYNPNSPYWKGIIERAEKNLIQRNKEEHRMRRPQKAVIIACVVRHLREILKGLGH